MTVYYVSVAVDTGWQQKFKSYQKLIHVTAYVFRFYRNLRALTQGQQPDKQSTLSLAEVKAAEVTLFKQSQARAYSEEKIKRLSAASPHPMRKDSPLRLVHPMLGDQGLLLVGGRLERSSLSNLQKHPVILSAKDYITKLLFQHNHVTLSLVAPPFFWHRLDSRSTPLGLRSWQEKYVKAAFSAEE